MKKYLGIFLIVLLVILQACNPKEPGFNSEYYLYQSYDITEKDNLIELDYFIEDYYLKFSEQVSLSLGNHKFVGEYKINNLDLVIDNLLFTFNKDKTLIEIVHEGELLIFKKAQSEVKLESFDKVYTLDSSNYEVFTFDLYQNQDFKLVFKNGDFPITTRGKYYHFNNYIVLNYENKLSLIEKHDRHIMLYFMNQSLKLISDGTEFLEEKNVNSLNYEYNTKTMSDLEARIENITSDNKYILSEELLTNNDKSKLYSYPDYKCFYSEYGDEFLYHQEKFFKVDADGYHGSYVTWFTSKEFFADLNQEYLVYQEDNTFYLSITNQTFVDNEYRSQLLSDYLFYNQTHLYYEIIFYESSFIVNIYNNNNLKFYKQLFEKHDLTDMIDLNNIKLISASNLSDAIFPIIIDEEYNIKNSLYKNYRHYFKIDFEVGYYTIETSKIERYQFLDEEENEIQLRDVFTEVENLDSNHNGYLLKFYVNKPVTYYLKVNLQPYGSEPFYNYSFKVRHFDEIEFEKVDFELDKELEVIVDDIFFGKEIQLSFSEDKVIYFSVESLTESLYFNINEDGQTITGTSVNKTFEGSLFVKKDSNYTLVFRKSARIIIKEGFDDNYQTNQDNPFNLESYDDEVFITGSAFAPDYFVLNTLDSLYNLSATTHVKLEITNQDNKEVKGRYDDQLFVYVYLLKPNEKYFIKASFSDFFIKYQFNLKKIPNGKVIIDSFPYEENVYFDQETTVEFTLKNPTLIYLNAGHGFLDLWLNNQMLRPGIEELEIALEAGTYQLRPNIDFEVFININIKLINKESNS